MLAFKCAENTVNVATLDAAFLIENVKPLMSLKTVLIDLLDTRSNFELRYIIPFCISRLFVKGPAEYSWEFLLNASLSKRFIPP